MEPRQVAQYRIEGVIGRGGQATVYLALDTRLDRLVALKLLEPRGPDFDSVLARFRREAEATSRLNHPGICTILDSGIDGDHAYIAMRYVEGEPLAELISRLREQGPGCSDRTPPSSRREIERIVRTIEKTARALHTAHEAGITHRDLKPGNLMLTKEGEPVLLDFGLAGAEDSAHSLTRTGDVFGTPAYMAPEQLRGHRADRRSDIYSLAATLYEWLTLTPPFAALTREGLFQAILREPMPDPRSLNPAIPSELSIVLQTCLDKDPAQRYATALDFAEDLRRVRQLEPIRARPLGAGLRLRRWAQRNPALAVSVVATFALLIVALLGTISFLEQERRNNRQLARQLQDVIEGRASRRAKQVVSLTERGFQLLVSADYGKARRLFEEALAIDPRNEDAVVARVWLDLERFDAARAALDRWAKPLRDDPDVIWLEALLLDQHGLYLEARELYGRAGPSETDTRAFLEGVRHARNFTRAASTDDYRAAIRSFEQAILRSPRPRFHYYSALMMAADRAGDTRSFRRGEEALLHHWPESGLTWETVAVYAFPKDPARFEEALERATELGGGSVAPYLGLAALALSKNDADAAAREYDRAIQSDPESALAHLHRATFRFDSGDREAARDDLLSALRIDPESDRALRMLVEVERDLGRVERAERELQELAAEAQRPATIFEQLALISIERGDRDEAFERFEQAVQSGGSSPGLLHTLDRLLEGGAGKEVAILERWSRIWPSNAEVWDRLAARYEEAQRPDDRRAALQQVARIRREDRPSWRQWLESLPEGETGLEALLALAIETDSVTGHRLHAECLTEHGDVAEAILELEDALQTHPADSHLRSQLAYLLIGQGKEPEARTLMRADIDRLDAGVAAHERYADFLLSLVTATIEERLDAYHHARLAQALSNGRDPQANETGARAAKACGL
ncbi:MAG: protein kinase [Planctomycetota bacterium]